ncbi:unnamed protein product, partial [marine sediment metagenome]
ITSDATSKLAKSPLLSSQRVLEAIFYKGVVVCEADSDRCVYQTVAVRQFSNQNILFVHAHNKQTIKDVVRLLKQATIPVCAIVDIDIMDSEDDFKNLHLALTDGTISENILEMRRKIATTVENVSEKTILEKLQQNLAQFSEQLKEHKHSLSGSRGALNRIRRETSNWSHVKKLGIEGIPEQERKTAEDLIQKLKKHGLFIVPVGELEGWLDLDTRQKSKWIIHALEALHQNKCDPKLNNFLKAILNHMGEDTN